LWAIKDRGGVAIVQSPAEAAYPSMPRSALRHVKVDYTLEIADIPNVLRSLTRERIEIKERTVSDKLEIETRISLEENPFEPGVRAIGKPSFFTCPDCHGSMVAIEEGSIRRFRCHTGHAYTERAFLDRSLPVIEETLWSALAQAEERATLLRELAQQRRSEEPEAAADYESKAQQMRRLIAGLRKLRQEPVFDRSAAAEPSEATGSEARSRSG
jgi:two-component system, chemotaxis family, protein-glutamate methylesterase/glutaminase